MNEDHEDELKARAATAALVGERASTHAQMLASPVHPTASRSGQSWLADVYASAFVRLRSLRSFVLNPLTPSLRQQSSVPSQHHQRIDRRRPAGGQQAGHERHDREHDGDTDERRDIGRLGVEQQRADGVREREGGDAAEHEAEQRRGAGPARGRAAAPTRARRRAPCGRRTPAIAG